MSERQPSSYRARLTGFPWLEALVAAVLFAAMVFHQRTLVPTIAALQVTYDREAFASIVQGWGEEAALLPQNLLIDLPFMLAYALFGYRLATRTPLLAFLPAGLRPIFPWLLPAAAATDAGENALEYYLAGHLESAADALFFAAGLVSAGKWCLIAVFTVAVLSAWRKPA